MPRQDKQLERARGAGSPRVEIVREGSTGQSIEASGAERVSVIIPAYNVAPYIAETLESVFAQTKSAFEVIIVNDGSPDTEKLEGALPTFRDRILYLEQENRGLSGARNTGIRAAKGDLIALLDGDDLWMPKYIETQTEFLRRHPEYDLVYCNARHPFYVAHPHILLRLTFHLP